METPSRLLKIAASSPRPVVFYLFLILSVHFSGCAASSPVVEFKVSKVEPSSPGVSTPQKPDQLPLSRVARGHHDITGAWLAAPTDRYRHGVLGDDLEATRLVVETRSGKQMQIDLPLRRVFEDLEPRLVDIDRDSRDEIIVVESDTALGAALAIYGIVEGQLKGIAATSFLGQPYRWLNPLGVGDFDGDGRHFKIQIRRRN